MILIVSELSDECGFRHPEALLTHPANLVRYLTPRLVSDIWQLVKMLVRVCLPVSFILGPGPSGTALRGA
jgi:hypothetical protein